MTRVSENSSTASLRHSINRTKSKLENLQLKGSTLKKITRPSDNPISSVESMAISSRLVDSTQYLRNADHALLHLNVTEKSLEQITDILLKAKEITLAQSSDFYDENVRRGVSNEVIQLRNQALAIGNKRVGQKYIFSGMKTLTRPFDSNAQYHGDKGQSTVEVSKDFFVPVNISGHDVFFSAKEDHTKMKKPHPLNNFPEMESSPFHKKLNDSEGPQFEKPPTIGRDLASENGSNLKNFEQRSNIFANLENLTSALENNDSTTIQALIEQFDDDISRLISLRTRVGSIINSIESAKSSIESDKIDESERKSRLVDADIAELFTNLQKEESVLKATYQATQGVLNKSLLDFLR